MPRTFPPSLRSSLQARTGPQGPKQGACNFKGKRPDARLLRIARKNKNESQCNKFQNSSSALNSAMPMYTYKEVVWASPADVVFSSAWRRIKLQKSVVLVLIKFHDGSLISTTIAVVRRRKYCNDISVMTPIVALHN